ncbi:LapA family protein [Paucibacter sp. M5-1]|uniref:LapA family protein n=1 Tax=Paucibacter sp. M5-1 TaxID=3015998 RepID=UPI0022B89BAC|nr:LapA family protein [Paucibacter sp. M5-1]MCZ7881108.1 LapA family protein [Paucibacter sp. M5-1]
MRIFVWLFRAFIFFALFAFALNNSQEATVRWFFGHEWRAPMVIIVLLAFGCGAALGVLAMVPAWWKHRRVAQRGGDIAAPASDAPTPTEVQTPSGVRDGL